MGCCSCPLFGSAAAKAFLVDASCADALSYCNTLEDRGTTFSPKDALQSCGDSLLVLLTSEVGLFAMVQKLEIVVYTGLWRQQTQYPGASYGETFSGPLAIIKPSTSSTTKPGQQSSASHPTGQGEGLHVRPVSIYRPALAPPSSAGLLTFMAKCLCMPSAHMATF